MKACQFCNGAYAPDDLAVHEPLCRFNPEGRKLEFCTCGLLDAPARIDPALAWRHSQNCPHGRAARRPSATVEAFRRFGERLEKKAHDTKKLGDEALFGHSATLVATAIMCVANEARDFAAELEKEGWGQ